MIKLFILAVILMQQLYATVSEEWYILPMGQGNAQLVIYSDGIKKIGVLYDLGSKSLQMHPKFINRGSWRVRYFQKITEKKEISSILGFTPVKNKNVSIQQTAFQTPASKTNCVIDPQTPMTVNSKLSKKQQKYVKENLESFILDLLQDLSHLFIFLSHSDEDHINYLNHKTVPSRLPLTILLCGDWFGDIGCRNNSNNMTKNVGEVLSFLKERLQQNPDLIEFSFPYYSNMQTGLVINFNDFLRQKLKGRESLKSLKEKLIKECSRNSLNSPIPEFYAGAFSDLYSKLFPQNSSSSAASLSFIDQIKQQIHIWSLNHQTDDINGQSIVLSCRLPSLDMSVIFTGDALHSTFQRIAAQHHLSNFRTVLGVKTEHLVVLMLPHHGAKDNSSGTALSFFQPDLVGISAGDGKQYGHPSYALIQYLENNYFDATRPQNFMQRYEQSSEGLDFVSIQNKKQQIIYADEEKIPFLCPNLYGCIKWDKNGISTNFDNVLEYGGNEYKILYSSHMWECSAKDLKALDIEGEIQVDSVYQKGQKCTLILKSNPSSILGYPYILQKKRKEELFTALEVDGKMFFYKIMKVE
ncbi:MAG: hypothetical protein C0432_02725 [Candidatus Puniceispirillum sp.]|nr:hypothetical protein [Candidatus Pelagibacter sp.]MBA4283190.1 hypothetical protein [Candidatus Puniceispirillum sp.]